MAQRDSDSLALEALGCIGAGTLFLGLVVYFALVNGWVLVLLWSWFVVPLGPPVLSLPIAVGIALILRLLTYVDTSNLQTKELSTGNRIAGMLGHLLSPWITLGFGWIVHLFV